MRYKQIIDKMSLEEKVGLLSGKDIWSTKAIKSLSIPSIVLSDGPHGVRKQSGAGDHLGLNASLPATCFPTAATVANSWDIELSEEIGKALGKEARELNVNVLLGPGLNIKRHPLCGRNFEYFSEDPYLSGKLAAAYIRGIQSQGVGACPKHFAANNQELRRMSNDSIVDERTLREIYLTGFEIAVKEGNPKTIMSSYNLINGKYTNEDPYLLKEILRDEWGFDGVVVTDWGGSNDHIEGVRNGSNLEMPGTGGDSDYQILKAVKDGKLQVKDVNERVDELLDLVFNTTKQEVDEKNEVKEISTEMSADHHILARKAAEESMVLLKNDDKILPLQKGTKVAIVGDFAKAPRYQGAGSSLVNPLYVDNILDTVYNFEMQYIGYATGYRRNGEIEQSLLLEAVELAKRAEVVLLCIGLEEIMEAEGKDRSHMNLHEKQIKLLEAISEVNENIVVFLAGGSSILMPWIKQCKAIVHGYLGGQASGEALLRIITGAVNPSGKLAESYWISSKDVPSNNYWHAKEKTSEYREGIFVGYRYYDTVGANVQFPFGFGLSYTTFEYSNLQVKDNSVTFKLTNTGKRDGAEIVQLYIGKENTSIFRVKKELKGFSKVILKVGESKGVKILLDDKAFRYFNISTKKWEREDGIYKIMVGANVQDIRLCSELYVEGTTGNIPYEKDKILSYFSGHIEQVSDREFEVILGRTIPNGNWNINEPLQMNDSLSQMYYAKSALARLVYHILTWRLESCEKKGKPDLNTLFIYNMTFRGIAKMLNGVVSLEMAENLLEIANGKFIKGFIGLVKSLKNKKYYCELKRILDVYHNKEEML